MPPVRSIILLSLLPTVFLCSTIQAQSLDSVFYQSYQLFDAADANIGIDRLQIRSLRSQMRTVQDITRRFNIEQIPKEYIASLNADAQLIQSALQAEKPLEAKNILESVSRDLDLKISYESAVAGARDIFRGRVTLRVTTKSEVGEVAGLIVSANPLRWSTAYPMFTLGPSSPALGSIPPGIYQFSASRAGQVIARQDISIGLTGLDSEEFIIMVPQRMVQ